MKLIISTSIFFMKNGYRSFNKYLYGLTNWKKNVETYFKDYTTKIIVYYDDSIKNNTKIFTEFNKITKDKLFEPRYFNYPEFKSKTHYGHLSTFGTIVRFLPLFENDDSIVMVRDLDIQYQSNNSYDHIYNFINNDEYKMLFYENYLEYNPSHLKLLPENKYHKKFLANGIFKTKWNKLLFDNFLKDTNNESSDVYKYLKEIREIDRRNSAENHIVYGYDELFLNYVLLNNVDKTDRIKIIRFYDNKDYLLKKLKFKYPNINMNDFHEIVIKYKNELTDNWIFVLNNWTKDKIYDKIFI